MKRVLVGLAVAMVAAACSGDSEPTAGADTELVDALASEFEEVTGLSSDDAACAAGVVVEEVGEAELREAGFPEVDPESVPDELTGRIGEATVEALNQCEVELGEIATGGALLDDDTSPEWEIVDDPPEEAPASEVVVERAGFSTYEWADETWATAAATLRNDGSGDGAGVQVTMTLRAADGTALATETATAAYVPPGGRAHVVVDFWENLASPAPVELDVQVADEPYPSEGAVLDVSVRDIQLDGGDIQIRGSVSNPTGERVSFASIQCVLVGPGGIVGGVDGSLDPIATGSDVAFQVGDSFGEDFEANAAECTAGVSL